MHSRNAFTLELVQSGYQKSLIDLTKCLQSDDAENIGYVIPVDVVQHFITDFDRNGRFTNFPILGIEWQKLESPYLRRSLRMKVAVCSL